MTRHFDIISIFPEIFESHFRESILKRAQDQGLLDINIHNLRDYTLNKHRKTDDYPFGGGVGAGLRKADTDLLEMINKAIDEARADGTLAEHFIKWFGKDISM